MIHPPPTSPRTVTSFPCTPLFRAVSREPKRLARDAEEQQRDRPDDEGLARDPAAFGLFGRGAGLVVDAKLACEFGDELRAAGTRNIRDTRVPLTACRSAFCHDLPWPS